jgi:hypothetical protein
MIERSIRCGALLAAVLVAAAIQSDSTALRAQAPAAQAAGHAERTAWYFYRVKWGFQEEFVRLFQKNHYPVLKDQMKSGRITAVRTYVPTYHGDGRADWTFAVAITFKDITAMVGPSGEAEIVRRLYPDQATFKKEEQRRFELLEAHWDVPLKSSTWKPKPSDPNRITACNASSVCHGHLPNGPGGSEQTAAKMTPPRSSIGTNRNGTRTSSTGTNAFRITA